MAAGPGYLDAEGVWIFGEDDTESLASDLLNLAQAATSTQLGADRARLDALEDELTEWTTWATAPTNLVVGTGGAAQMVQRYKRIAGRYYIDYRYVLGSSGASVGSGPTINLPFNVAILNPQGGMTVGDGAVYDLSAAATPAFTKAVLQSATTARIFTYTGTIANITGTAPITWAAGDILAGGFWVDPA